GGGVSLVTVIPFIAFKDIEPGGVIIAAQVIMVIVIGRVGKSAGVSSRTRGKSSGHFCKVGRVKPRTFGFIVKSVQPDILPFPDQGVRIKSKIDDRLPGYTSPCCRIHILVRRRIIGSGKTVFSRTPCIAQYIL